MEKTIEKLRLGEEVVTKAFDSSKTGYQNVVGQKLKELGIDVVNKCSGDDCVSLPARALAPHEQKQVLEAIAKSTDEPAKYRMTFIPEGVVKKDRTELSVYGELIEKSLRSKVTGYGEGLLPPKLLDKVLFAVDMPKDFMGGDPKLLMQIDPRVTLTETERKLISEAFDKATVQVRAEVRAAKAKQLELPIGE